MHASVMAPNMFVLGDVWCASSLVLRNRWRSCGTARLQIHLRYRWCYLVICVFFFGALFSLFAKMFLFRIDHVFFFTKTICVFRAE